ncbi:hypothetical protein [Streptomyces sp. NPDC048560]|uniref:hypothetical protein n=1 Tax=Streptomyces sp. NPDC048560 TaxID=3155488 RepID=UPI00342E638B
MTGAVTARPVATLTAPLGPAGKTADAPSILRWPTGRRLLVQRGDTEVAVVDLDAEGTPQTRFPAPWPRAFGTFTVSPDAGLAVFAGLHAVRAVEPSGARHWEVRHGCWDGGCRVLHRSHEEYATGSRSHLHADSGSAMFSADGSVVWAHIRGPVAAAGPDPEAVDEWLVIDAFDGSVLGRADAGTVAAGSDHVPHPDPALMGLSVGEGQDGSPLLRGRWDGQELTVDHFCDSERILASVSPSGKHFLTVGHDQASIALHETGDAAVVTELDAEDSLPRHPDADEDDPDADHVMWDYVCGHIDEEWAVAGTTEHDEEYGAARHWLLRTADMDPARPLAYPTPVSGVPWGLGDGTWYTTSPDGGALHLWALHTPRP